MSEVTTAQTAAYVPGVCNINREEIAQRRKAGHLGAAIFVGLLVILLAAGLNRWIRLALFLPGFLAAIGYLQAREHFCVGFAAAGTQNATEGSKAASSIADAAAVAKDKAHARELNLKAAGIALVLAALTLIIPT